jgi:hypothetical protein
VVVVVIAARNECIPSQSHPATTTKKTNRMGGGTVGIAKWILERLVPLAPLTRRMPLSSSSFSQSSCCCCCCCCFILIIVVKRVLVVVVVLAVVVVVSFCMSKEQSDDEDEDEDEDKDDDDEDDVDKEDDNTNVPSGMDDDILLSSFMLSNWNWK